MHPQPWFSSFFNVYFEKLWHLLSLDIHCRKWLIGKITQVSLYHWQTVNRNVTMLKFTWCHLHIFFCLHANCTSPIMHLICRPPPAPLSPTNWYKHCLQFLLGRSQYPKEIKNKGYAKLWGANKVHYGRCASGVSLHHQQQIQIVSTYGLDTGSVKRIRGCGRQSRVTLPRCTTTYTKTFFFISLKFENPWLFCHLRPKEDKSTSY